MLFTGGLLTVVSMSSFDEMIDLVNSNDVDAIVENNNKYRTYGATGDIWNASSLVYSKFNRAKFTCPMIIAKDTEIRMTPSWKCVKLLEKNYAKRCCKFCPFRHYDLLRTFNSKYIKLVIAGGAASAMFSKHPQFGDIDVFLIKTEKGRECTDSEMEKQLDIAISQIMTYIVNAPIGSPISITKGLITVGADPRDSIYSCGHTLQFILRLYPTISTLLHSFDIGSACVAQSLDHNEVFLTTSAVYSIVHHVNIVVPEYASYSYCNRLIKNFNRGYSILLPHYRTDYKSRDDIWINQIKLTNIRFKRKNKLLIDPEEIISSSMIHSDYEHLIVNGEIVDSPCAINEHVRRSIYNTRAICTGSIRFVANDVDFEQDRINKVGDLIDIEKSITQILEYIVSTSKVSTLNITMIKWAFDPPPEVIDSILGKYIENRNILYAVMRLKPFIADIIKKYSARKDEKIDWTISHEPSEISPHLFSSTLNPTPMNLEEFYKPDKNEVNELLGTFTTMGELVSHCREGHLPPT